MTTSTPMTTADLTAALVRYVRDSTDYVTHLTEPVTPFASPTGERPDLIVWNVFQSVVYDVKISVEDAKAHKKKSWVHQSSHGMGQRRYLVSEAYVIEPHHCPPGWGLLWYDPQTEQFKEHVESMKFWQFHISMERALLVHALKKMQQTTGKSADESKGKNRDVLAITFRDRAVAAFDDSDGVMTGSALRRATGYTGSPSKFVKQLCAAIDKGMVKEIGYEVECGKTMFRYHG